MTHEFHEIAGTPVYDINIQGEAELQRYGKIIPLEVPEGHMVVGQWLDPQWPGCIKTLRLMTLPVMPGAGPLLPAAPTGKVHELPEVHEPAAIGIPPLVKALSDKDLITLAQQIGARITPEMDRTRREIAMAKAVANVPLHRLPKALRPDPEELTRELQPVGKPKAIAKRLNMPPAIPEPVTTGEPSHD